MFIYLRIFIATIVILGGLSGVFTACEGFFRYFMDDNSMPAARWHLGYLAVYLWIGYLGLRLLINKPNAVIPVKWVFILQIPILILPNFVSWHWYTGSNISIAFVPLIGMVTDIALIQQSRASFHVLSSEVPFAIGVNLSALCFAWLAHQLMLSLIKADKHAEKHKVQTSPTNLAQWLRWILFLTGTVALMGLSLWAYSVYHESRKKPNANVYAEVCYNALHEKFDELTNSETLIKAFDNHIESCNRLMWWSNTNDYGLPPKPIQFHSTHGQYVFIPWEKQSTGSESWMQTPIEGADYIYVDFGPEGSQQKTITLFTANDEIIKTLTLSTRNANNQPSEIEANQQNNIEQQAAIGETVELPSRSVQNQQRFVVFNDTIKDNSSGLIWQRCSVGQTWDGKACAGTAIKLTLQEAQKYEVQGWRLPSVEELKSLRNCSDGFEEYGEHGRCKGDPKVRAYHESFDMVGDGMYASFTKTKQQSDYYWLVSFKEAGGLIPVPIKIMPFYYRLVRDDAPLATTTTIPAHQHSTLGQQNIINLASDEPRFVAENDIVIDKHTKLIWQRCSVGQTWSGNTCQGQAKEFSFDDALKQAGNGWRLPSIRELLSLRLCSKGENSSTSIDLQDKGELVAFECIAGSSQPTIDPIFKNTAMSHYWSASIYSEEPPFAWYAGFNKGDVDYQLIFGQRFVRLVHDGYSQPALMATQKNDFNWPFGLPVKMHEQSGWHAEFNLTCLEVGKACATINYKTLNCGGDLVFKGQEGNFYKFDQKLTYGNCVQGCDVVLDASTKTYTEHCPSGIISEGGILVIE